MSLAEQVDAWLAAEGLALDCAGASTGASPSTAAPELTVQSAVHRTVQIAKSAKESGSAGWTAKHSGRLHQVFSRKFPRCPIHTVMSSTVLAGASMRSFGVFANHDNMFKAAQLWDATFVGASTVKTFGDVLSPVAHARVIRWQFAGGPLATRELLYVVVPVAHDTGATFCYLSIRGPSLAPPKGVVRARLLFPSFDDVEEVRSPTGEPPGPVLPSSDDAEERVVAVRQPVAGLLLHHAATCQLRGNIGSRLQRWFVDPSVATAFKHEVKRIEGLFADPNFQALL